MADEDSLLGQGDDAFTGRIYALLSGGWGGQRAHLVTSFSQLPLAQNNPYPRGEYLGVVHSGLSTFVLPATPPVSTDHSQRGPHTVWVNE